MAEVQEFENDEQKKATLIHNLLDLQDSTGWKIIEKYLDGSIEIAESKLHGETELKDDESTEVLQRERLGLIRLKNLPKQIIEENEPNETFDSKLDPYA